MFLFCFYCKSSSPMSEASPPFHTSSKSHGKKSEGNSSHEIFTIGSVGSQKGFRMMERCITATTTTKPKPNILYHLQK